MKAAGGRRPAAARSAVSACPRCAARVAALQEAREHLAILRSDLEVAERGTQAAMREVDDARAQCARLYDFAPNAYVTLDRAGIIRDANGAAAELLGEDRVALCDTLFMRFVVDEDRRDYFRHLSRCRRSEYPATIVTDLALVCGAGRRQVHLLSVPDPRADPAPRPVLYRTALVDLSDIRRAEQSLRESETRYRLLFEGNPCPMYIVDENTLDFLDVNEAALHLYGYSREAFLAMTVKDIRPPGDVPALVAAMRTQRMLLHGGALKGRRPGRRGVGEAGRIVAVRSPGEGVPLSAGEWRHVKRDGAVFDAAITISPTRYDGREARLVLVNDITARKAAEAAVQHRLALEQLLAATSSRLANVSIAGLEAAVNEVLANVGSFMGADRCYLFRVADDLSVAHNTHEWCGAGIHSQIDDLRTLPTALFRWMLKRMRHGTPLCIPHVADIPPEAAAERQLMAQWHVQSALLVPIRHGGTLTGFIGCDAVRGEREWPDTDVRLLGIVGETLAEVQARARTDEALQQAAQEWTATFDGVSDAVWVLDTEQRILRCNQASAALFGRSMEDMVGRHCWEIVHGTRAPIPECPVSRLKRTHQRESMELEMDGRWYQVTVDPLIDPNGELRGVVHAVSDITARKQAEASLRTTAAELERRVAERTTALHETTERLQGTLDAAHAIAWELDVTNGTLYERGPVAELSGRPAGFRHGSDAAFFENVHPDDRAYVRAQVQRAIQSGSGEHGAEFRMRLLDGSIHWAQSSGSIVCDPAGRPVRLRGITLDVTRRKEAELAVARTHRALRVLSEGNSAVVRAMSEAALLEEVCRIVVGVGGYRLAWVGYAEHDARQSVRPMAHMGFRAGYPTRLTPSWGKGKFGRGPTGTAIRTGQPCVCRDVAKDPLFAPWRKEALKQGCAAVAALPLMAESGCLGQLTVGAAYADAFDEAEVQLLQQLANNLAFGILGLRGRAERAELERQMLDITEREQCRIGQDLHDGVLQSIIAVSYLISATRDSLGHKSVPEADELDRVTQMLGKIVQQAHDLAGGLFPRDLKGGRIADALRELASHTQDLFGIAVCYSGLPTVKLLDASVARQVYRIAQEAVNNAAKHSKGSSIDIRLSRRRGRIALDVRDTGVGMSRTAGQATGMGQRTMKYRADMIGATLTIESVRGQGTTVSCVLPRSVRTRK
jgi:PAS domain S-box-containing protein